MNGFSLFTTIEKSEWKHFFLIIFAFISKPDFDNKKKVFPLFLRKGWADRTENFSTSTWGKSGCVFFFSPQNLVSIKFGSPYKIQMIKKILVFDKVFSILLLLTSENDIFQNKKNTHPDWVLVTIEKVSARTDEVSIFAGGKLWVIFASCDPQNSVKEACENFDSTTAFAVLIEIYLPWEFHKFSPSRFSETPERGGGSP